MKIPKDSKMHLNVLIPLSILNGYRHTSDYLKIEIGRFYNKIREDKTFEWSHFALYSWYTQSVNENPVLKASLLIVLKLYGLKCGCFWNQYFGNVNLKSWDYMRWSFPKPFTENEIYKNLREYYIHKNRLFIY